jgi:nitroreductase
VEIQDIIFSRRSVRKYRPDPVDDDLLARVLEAARWAPSWANTQCWRFIVVRDPQVKDALANTLIGVSGKSGSTENPPRPNRAAIAIKEAPLAVVACAQLGRSGFFRDDPVRPVTGKGDWYMFDVALAMQNLVLAAHSLGLGTVYVGAFDAPAAARILEVPEGFAVVAITPLGYPDEEPPATKRKEPDEIIFRDRFGKV